MFDIEKIVFSARGSYIGLFKRAEHHGGGLWIRTLINSEWGSSNKKKMTTQLLKILPFQSGRFVEYQTEFFPHMLRLYNETGEIVFHIANAYTLEAQIRNFDLVFEHDHDELFAANIEVHDHDFAADYLICRTHVEIAAKGGRMQYDAKSHRVFLSGSKSLQVMVKRSDLVYQEQEPVTKEQRQNEFQEFYQTMGIDGDMAQLAAYLLWSGTYSPLGRIRRECSPISKYKMGMLLMWANCFIGLSLVNTDRALAKNNYLVLLDYQKENGSVQDAINPVLSVEWFTKPPVYGYFYSLYREMGVEFEEQEQIGKALIRMAGYWTDNQGSLGLCRYTHPWDSGMDNASCFDDILPISTPDLNTYMVLLYDAIGEIYESQGKQREGNRYRKLAETYLAKFISLCWNGKEFTAVSDRGKQIPLTNACKYIPMILGRKLPTEIAEQMVSSLKSSHMITRWSIASESTDSMLYDTRRGDTVKPSAYWRGPVWPYFVFLIGNGLRSLGELDTAMELEQRFIHVVDYNHGGIYENYDALTGIGYDDSSDVWSAAVYLMLKARAKVCHSDGSGIDKGR